MRNYKKSFGKTIKQHRIANKLGQRELARRVGVSSTYLTHIEAGKSNPPSEEIIQKLAEELGMNPDVLLAKGLKVDTAVTDAIINHPNTLPKFIRELADISDEDIEMLIVQCRRNILMPNTRQGIVPDEDVVESGVGNGGDLFYNDGGATDLPPMEQSSGDSEKK